MTIFRPLGLAAGLIFLAAPTFAVPTNDAQDTFDEGIQLLQRGREEEALHAFQKVLAMDLSNAEAYELWKSTDAEIWLEMLTKEGDMQIVTQRLMSMAKMRRTEQRDDADMIRELLTQVTGEDILARTMATRQLSADHGEYAVQYMLPSLGDQTGVDRRVLVMGALTSMGDDVVLPLCAALDTPDAFLRRNVAVTLGYIGDSRAAAYLAHLAASDSDEGVMSAAKDALASCGGAGRGAEYAFLVMGNGYHMGSPSVLRATQYSDVVWSFTGGSLQSTTVPRYLYSEELAKVSFYNALRVNASSKGALTGLARVYASQMQKISDQEASGMTVGSEADQARAGMLAVAASGSGAIDAGLISSMAEGDSMAAIGLCRAVQSGLAVAGKGLQAALAKGDADVRCEAALALASQARGKPLSAATIAALGEATGRNIVRVAAIIDGNEGRAAAAKAALEAEGMVVNHWTTGAKGIANLYRVPGLDVILVADRLSDLTTDQVITEIAGSANFAETPIMILAKNGDNADELYGSRTAGILTGGDFSSVSGVLSDSLGRDRERADDLSRRASMALSRLAASGTDVSGAMAGLTNAAMNRPDGVALPALRALGACGTMDSVATVAGICGDDSRSDKVREAAAMACAEMFTNGVGGNGALDSLHGVVTSDAALSVRGAAAAALGRLKLDPSMRAELLRLVRVNVGE